MFVFDDPGQPAHHRRAWLVVAVLVLAAGFGVYRYATRDFNAVGVGGYTCGFVTGEVEALAEGLCDRQMADRSRRDAITDPGPIGYDGTAETMVAAISRAVLCPPAPAGSCASRADRRATDADVRAARDALAAAGLPQSVVRIAEPDDPAPTGSRVFALLMGDGCVVGYLDLADGERWHEVGGLLPNGQCLST